MEAADLFPLLEQLDDNVDDLEEALMPILGNSVLETSKKLPVLDKAKFNVLVTYALESLIFSYLRLHGVNAKEHPVFKELTRVKQYFEKIKALETEPEQRTMTLDKEAASRFIKHGLAGNDKLDMERREKEAKEKARAQLKASLLAKKVAASENSSKNPTSASNSDPGSDGDSDSEQEMVAQAPQSSQSTHSKDTDEKKKKNKKGKSERETAKAAKKRKLSKEERQEAKKERRQKKQKTRKAMTTK